MERDFGLGRAVEAEHAHLQVGRERLRPEDLREPPGAIAPLQLHLKQPFLGMHKAQAISDVFVVLRYDLRHAVGIPLDPYLCFWSRENDTAFGLRKRRPKIEIEPGAEGEQQPQQRHPHLNPLPLAGEGMGGGGHYKPSSRKILSRSASGSGAGGRVGGSAKPESFIGLPASLREPVIGSSTEISMLRAPVWGCASACATLLTGPHGTPAASNTLIQCSVFSVRSTLSISARSASWCWLRSALVVNSGLAASSGQPSASASLTKSPSLPAAMIRFPSSVSNASNGVIEGWRAPIGPGISPVVV